MFVAKKKFGVGSFSRINDEHNLSFRNSFLKIKTRSSKIARRYFVGKKKLVSVDFSQQMFDQISFAQILF